MGRSSSPLKTFMPKKPADAVIVAKEMEAMESRKLTCKSGG
jgi:hypothetical protein